MAHPRPAPTVSVVVPTYNQPGLLLETLGTVFAQSFDDYEVVVVNDGSTDDTADRLRPLVERHGPDRLRVVTQANVGIGGARNRGIDEARGRYVALLDHDDLWRPDKLAAQVDFMAAHPACAACSVPWAMSDAPDRPGFDVSAVRGPDGVIDRPLRHLAHGRVFLISSSILFDRARAGGLRYERIPRCIEDTPFQIGLFAAGPFGLAGGDDVLMVYRKHAANYSAQAAFFANGIRMLRRRRAEGLFEQLSPTDRKDLDEFLAHLGRTATAAQLLEGRRVGSLGTYLRELPYQLGRGRWKFLLTAPVLSVMPLSIVRRAF